MNILVIGSGGREHAIVKKFSESKQVNHLYISPGNPGMRKHAKLVVLKTYEDIVTFAKDNQIDFVFVGPEQPLAEGIIDKLNDADIPAIGPTAFSAQIETSKVFSKAFMKEYAIPTADYYTFKNTADAQEYLNKCCYPLVIKADGLAAGKGVIIANNKQEGLSAVNEMMLERKFGDSGSSIVIEEYLTGWEVSVFAFCDGDNFLSTIFSQDHKALNEGDTGPNTGGMGAYAPVNKADIYKAFVDQKVFSPVLKGFKDKNQPYKGILFAGLMITETGPKVLEFNARFGDPETEVILPLLKTDLVDICQAIIKKEINKITLEWEENYCVSVVAASGGYPEKYKNGYEIIFGKDFSENESITFYSAGITENHNKLYTNGGRVFMLSAKAETLNEAVEKAYHEINKISFENMYYRHDIAHKGLH